MKPIKLSTKLNLKKTTVTNLTDEKMSAIKGGATELATCFATIRTACPPKCTDLACVC